MSDGLRRPVRVMSVDEMADRIEELEAENNLLKTSGIIEVAAHNNRVTEYMFYWEGRALDAEAKLAKAVGLLEAWVELSGHCSIEEGVCCCGDNMDNHTNPMDCGHTPLDHGTYIATRLGEETRDTLAEIKG